MIGNCPDYCNPQFHYDPHLQTKWKFEISTIIIQRFGTHYINLNALTRLIKKNEKIINEIK